MADVLWTWRCRNCRREGSDLDEGEARVAALEHEDESLHETDVTADDTVLVQDWEPPAEGEP